MDLVLSCVAIVGLLITVGKVLDDSWDLKTKEELSLRLFKGIGGATKAWLQATNGFFLELFDRLYAPSIGVSRMRLASWNALLAAPIMLVLLRISPNAWMPVMARENESEGLLVVALLWTGGIALFYAVAPFLFNFLFAVVSFLFKSLSKFAGYHLDRQWTLSAKQKVLKVLVYSVPVAILALAYFGSYLRKYLTIDEVSDVWSNWTLLPALALVVLYIVTEVPITTRLEKVVGRTLHS